MATSPGTSLTLLDRLRAGDPDSWQRMLTLYGPLLRAWLRHRGSPPADVDDLAQNALAVVFRRLPEFRHSGRPGAFRAWLRGVVTNVVREHRRAAARLPGDDGAPFDDLEDPAGALDRWWDAEHDRHVLRGLLNLVRPEFTPTSFEAFRRTALDGQSAAEAAADLGISANAVHIARSRVMARLRHEARGLVDDA